MKVFVSLGWYSHNVVDITPAELALFQQVLDKMVPAERWYGDADAIKLGNPNERDKYRIQLIPGNHPIVAFQPPVVEAEGSANG